MTHPIPQRHMICEMSEAAPRSHKLIQSKQRRGLLHPHPKCFRLASSCSVALFQPWLPLWVGCLLMLITICGSGLHHHLPFMKRLVHGVSVGKALDFGPRSLKVEYAVCFCNATHAITSPVVSPLTLARVVVVHASMNLQKGPSPEHQNNELWTNVQLILAGLGWWSGIGRDGAGWACTRI